MTLRYKLRIIEAEAAVEYRKPEMVYDGVVKSWNQAPNTRTKTHRISAFISGKKVGYLKFVQMENCPGSIIDSAYSGKKIEKAIYFEDIQVKDEYKSGGIGSELLKKFGEIMSQNFSGWPVIIYYINPVAEYAYRKAVSLGYIPDYTLDESWIQREPDVYQGTENEQVVKDLRGKLPENVRGPEVWARRKDLRRING